MLQSLNTPSTQAMPTVGLAMDNRYNRIEKDDMQKAIEYLYEFKKKLDELHPNCIYLVDQILQKRTY